MEKLNQNNKGVINHRILLKIHKKVNVMKEKKINLFCKKIQ